MEINIRRAKREDCPRLLELVTELAVYEKAPEQVTISRAHFEESGFGANPVWWAFVATVPVDVSDTTSTGSGNSSQRDHILGFALYYIRFSTWKGQRMYLEDIVVTADARGKGIGKMLMDRLIEEAREKQFTGMMWQVLEWNEPAINFYKKYNANLDAEWINCSLNFV